MRARARRAGMPPSCRRRLPWGRPRTWVGPRVPRPRRGAGIAATLPAHPLNWRRGRERRKLDSPPTG
eukprot:3399267-Alexandrium_andersonii.AAC.1